MRLYKKIGIDIDNCLTNLDITLGVMAEYYNQPTPKIEDITDYNLSSVYGISPEQSREFWLEKEYDICADSEANQDRLSNFYRLFVSDGTEIYIITNRHERYRDVTTEWLKRNHIPFKKFIMTSGVSKVNVLRKYKIELMIDDKPSLFHEAKEAGIETKMVCVDYSYNKDVPCYMRLNRFGRGMTK